MATATKENFSGSTSGRGIKIVQTATAGTTIHAAHATKQDEVWLWVVNSQSAAVKLTVEMGGVTVPDDLLEVTIPGESGLVAVIPGISFTGSVEVAAWAATGNVLVAYGYVNRITN